ncbi:MAG: hypothetical protein U5O15_06090 [Candidatus Krumholzibacteriota bacterium]|nr:hypothetical protein [Candidatus Krumholzibacteriota bacterium]
MKIIKTLCVLVSAILTVMAFFIYSGCRLEEEPLDKNREPETYLTYAPPETLNADYKVHLYWHGEDKDGMISKYIFYISDSLRTLTPLEDRNAEMLDWNPANRKSDYLKGNFTTRTDTVIMFEGYDAEKKETRNRQAFHIAAVDDGGLIDETPARIQFFATVDAVPVINYWVKIGDKPYNSYDPSSLDTVSLFTPLRFKFQGITEVAGDVITGYNWSVSGVTYPRDKKDPNFPSDEPYIPAPGEIVEFPSEDNKYYIKDEYGGFDTLNTATAMNTKDNPLENGDFYFRGVARDQAGAQSEANPVSGDGLCHIVINFDPDTKVLWGDNYFLNQYGEADSDTVSFSDVNLDTLPLNSVLRINYTGWDDQRDILEYDPPIPIRFKYKLQTNRYSNLEDQMSSASTPYFPILVNAENNNPGEIDSVSMTIGSGEYIFSVRSYDEQYRYDHTPAEVTFYGNFQPTVESFEVGVFEYVVNPYSDDDTIFVPLDPLKLADPTDIGNWCFSCPESYLNSEGEVRPVPVIGSTGVESLYYPILLRATGHDDSRDPPWSAVKSWYYWVEGNSNLRDENKMLYPDTDNILLKDIRINIPLSGGAVDTTRLGEIPSGVQNWHIIGFDLGRDCEFDPEENSCIFKQKIRSTPGGDIYSSGGNLGNYARKDTLEGQFYIENSW